jgi:hypothetical protein
MRAVDHRFGLRENSAFRAVSFQHQFVYNSRVHLSGSLLSSRLFFRHRQKEKWKKARGEVLKSQGVEFRVYLFTLFRMF